MIDKLTIRFNEQLLKLASLNHVINYSLQSISPDSFLVEAIVLIGQKIFSQLK